MADVYVVLVGYDYEGEVVQGIWSTWEAADRQFGELLLADHGDTVALRRCALDSPSGGVEIKRLATPHAATRAREYEERLRQPRPEVWR